MFIETVSTPNPNTLKFIPGCDVLPGSTKEYTNAMQAQESPLAEKIFAIDGISGVFFSDDFITVTKTKFEWPQLKPIILGEIMDHFISGQPLLIADNVSKMEEFFDPADSETVDKIKELRPVNFKSKDTGEYNTGMIAEEVAEVMPEITYKADVEGFDTPQVDGITYEPLHAYYIKAIQELSSKIEQLESRIQTLENN